MRKQRARALKALLHARLGKWPSKRVARAAKRRYTRARALP